MHNLGLQEVTGPCSCRAAEVECCTTAACMHGPSPALQAPTLAGKLTCQSSKYLAHLGLMQYATDRAHQTCPLKSPKTPHLSRGGGPKGAITRLAQQYAAGPGMLFVPAP